VLLDVLAKSLRLLHPLLPFLTEEIYSKLPEEIRSSERGSDIKNGELLVTAPYPVYDEKLADEEAEREFAFLQDLVRQLRTLRSECTIPPEKKIRVLARIREDRDLRFLTENAPLVKLLAGIGDLEIAGTVDGEKKPAASIALMGNGFEAFAFIAEAVDMKMLKQRFAKELEKDLKYIEGLKAKLANENFLKNAPPELVAEEKLKLEDSFNRTGKLESYMRDMA
jgi:valyl-tRNA synthetase